MTDQMKEQFHIAYKALYSFMTNPFDSSIRGAQTDKELVSIATIICSISALFQFIFGGNTDQDSISIAIRLIMIPVVARIIVYFSGAIFYYYLKWIASRLVKTRLNNAMYAKQIMVFSSIGISLGYIPYMSIVSIILIAAIEFVGLRRLYELNLNKSLVVVAVYQGLVWSLIYGIIQLTKLV